MASEISIKMPLVRVARFRHGESCANAGSATTDPASIQLTEKGKRQACTIGELAANPPSIIICSPYLRAKETAAPTLRRFPSTPWEIWPIQEFTYLAQDRCAGTSPAQRRPWVENYWQLATPDLLDGPGAESSGEFIGRVRNALDCMTSFYSERDFTMTIFGHGQFFQAMRWLIENRPPTIDSYAMPSFRQIDLDPCISRIRCSKFV